MFSIPFSSVSLVIADHLNDGTTHSLAEAVMSTVIAFAVVGLYAVLCVWFVKKFVK